LNSLAVGEADSALDLDRIADHVEDKVLSRKIYRHFTEENKHARLFRKHLESHGLTPKPLPPELDYETTGQMYGMDTPKARIDDPRPLRLEPMPRAGLTRYGVFPGPDEVSKRLVVRARDVDRSKLSRSVQTGQTLGVSPVGLDAIAAAPRQHRRGDHDALKPLSCEVTVEVKPARTRS
jgi:hypothetical protein